MTTKKTPILRRNKLALVISLIASTTSASVLANDAPIVSEEIIITGSYIRSTPGDAATPVQVLGRDYIDSIGATTIADVLEKLPINSGSENQADSFTQGATQGTSNVNLRGLGLSSTLVLINGRRQTISGALTNDGSVFVDTSTIPIDALERVEVLKEGASSTYGSDAIAGVVNFILRKDFDGFEFNAGYSTITDGNQDDTDLGFIWGGGTDNTHFTLSGHYLDRTPLSTNDRPELAENAISSLGNTFLPFSDVTVTSGPYAGSYNAFENVPDPACLESEGGVLIPQASGSRCGFRYGPRYNLVNTETRMQLYSNLTHTLSDTSELFAELGYTSNEVKDNPQSPSYPDLSFPIIDANHPSNPFGVSTLWLGRPLGASFDSPLAPRENKTLRASVSLNGKFNDNWDWNTSVTYSQNKYKQFLEDTLRSRLAAGLAGVGGPENNEYFDPFFPENNSMGLINDFSYVTESEKTTDLLSIDAVASGELFELPGGTVGAAFGIQIRNEGFQVETDDVYEIQFDENGNPIPIDLIFLGGLSEVNENRNIFAAFAEAKFPVSEDFEITTALRYEELENANSIDPKLAIRWQLSDQWILRGATSTAFREPSLSQKHASAVTLNGIQDFDESGNPVGGISFIRVAAIGSDKLEPEKSTNYNIGVIYQPTDTLDLKVDYWGIDYDDLITVENAQGKILTNPLGEDIVRDGFGNLIGVNVEYFNSSSVKVDGLDFEASWTVNDAWSIAANIAHFLNYEITLPTGETIDAAGYFNNDNFARSMPKTKGNVSFDWSDEIHGASLNINYISSYEHNQPVPETESQTIDSFVTADIQYRATLSGLSEDDSTAVSIGVTNLFDQAPPRVYDGANLSYDPKQHNPLGRVIYAKIKYNF